MRKDSRTRKRAVVYNSFAHLYEATQRVAICYARTAKFRDADAALRLATVDVLAWWRVSRRRTSSRVRLGGRVAVPPRVPRGYSVEAATPRLRGCRADIPQRRAVKNGDGRRSRADSAAAALIFLRDAPTRTGTGEDRGRSSQARGGRDDGLVATTSRRESKTGPGPRRARLLPDVADPVGPVAPVQLVRSAERKTNPTRSSSGRVALRG